MAVKSIVIFEHQKLLLGDHPDFTEKRLEALVKYQDRENSSFFSLCHRGIRFCEFVGALQIDGLTIEVLPKADKPDGNENDKEKAVWQKVLIDMLRKVNGFDIQVTSDASLKLKPNAILHFYFEMFVKEVELLVHQGLVKRYRKEEGNQNALKGSLLFGQQIQKNLTHQERFFVRYTTYDRNNPYNRVLLKTLKVLQHLNTSPALQSRISGLILNFPELPDIAVSEAFFEKLVINRKTEGYKKALQISKLILLNYHPDLSKGRNDVLALMFDMNKLWEQYILVCLRREGHKHDILVKGKEHHRFWKPEGLSAKKIEPDIVIRQGKTVIVVDTKWKRPEVAKPDDGDLKQLYVYNLFWEAKESYLLYPGNIPLVKGGYYHFQTKTENHNHCSQAWISVLDETQNNLNPKLGLKLLESFQGLLLKK